MKVLGKGVILDYMKNHANLVGPISAWLYEAEDADWKSPTEITARYASASIISENRVVFNIKGNKYRLDVKISYENKTVLIKRIGTHSEYSKWKF